MHGFAGHRLSGKEPAAICWHSALLPRGSARPGAPPKSVSSGTRVSRTETVKRNVEAYGRMPVPSLSAAGAALSSRPGGGRSSVRLRTIAGLRLLFLQHLSQPVIRAGLPPKEAPDDQNQEGQAAGQDPPPGSLLLPSQGTLHSPAGRAGSAGGKVNGTTEVVLLAPGRGLGASPGTGRRRQASGSPAPWPQHPDGPGRERESSERAARRCRPQPAATARSSPCRGHTEDPVHRDPGSSMGAAARHICVTSVARTGKPFAVRGLRLRRRNVGSVAQRK